MSNMTLLRMTQKILNAMGSDQVNSISDTIEAEAVVHHIEDTYEHLCSIHDIPFDRLLLQLESGTVSKPTHMKIPETARSVSEIRYDSRNAAADSINYKKIIYRAPDSFLHYINTRNSTATDISTITDFSGASLKIRTDANPSYWTSFDDEYIVFDSYKSTLESTLQASKSLVISNTEQAFSSTDTFTFNLPRNLRQYLYEEAKKACFYYMKGEADQLGVKRSREQKIKFQTTTRTKGPQPLGGFGRRR